MTWSVEKKDQKRWKGEELKLICQEKSPAEEEETKTLREVSPQKKDERSKSIN